MPPLAMALARLVLVAFCRGWLESPPVTWVARQLGVTTRTLDRRWNRTCSRRLVTSFARLHSSISRASRSGAANAAHRSGTAIGVDAQRLARLRRDLHRPKRVAPLEWWPGSISSSRTSHSDAGCRASTCRVRCPRKGSGAKKFSLLGRHRARRHVPAVTQFIGAPRARRPPVPAF